MVTRKLLGSSNANFAKNSATRLYELTAKYALAPDQKKMGRPLVKHSAAANKSIAARFIVACERKFQISRLAFKDLLVEALHGDPSAKNRNYFENHPSVYNDWLIGTQRVMPVWAAQAVVEIMHGMLDDPNTPPKLRDEVQASLPKVIEDIGGGTALVQWVVSNLARCSSPAEQSKKKYS